MTVDLINPLVHVVDVDAYEVHVAVIRVDGGSVTPELAAAALHAASKSYVTRDCDAPHPMVLTCPAKGCDERHVDEGEWATRIHHTHACQQCGHVWRPAVFPTVGVRFLPGFKDGST